MRLAKGDIERTPVGVALTSFAQVSPLKRDVCVSQQPGFYPLTYLFAACTALA